MANFANLKAAINAVIKQNGQGEITGDVMNQVLTAMVNSLGSNYQFAGVATPSTNPGTPDQNVFYMATQAGTYTNFSAIVLQAGISILLWDGSWSSETFFTIDSEPTAGSNNFITSGAVFDKFKLDGGAYDVTAHNNNATFADLSALLNSENLNTLIPVAIRHGGMSIKFVQTSDNKYVQFRCIADEFTTDVTKWQGVDNEPTVGSENLVQSGGVFDNILDKTEPLVNSVGFNGFEKTYTAENDGIRMGWDGSVIATFTNYLSFAVFLPEGCRVGWTITQGTLLGCKVFSSYPAIGNTDILNITIGSGWVNNIGSPVYLLFEFYARQQDTPFSITVNLSDCGLSRNYLDTYGAYFPSDNKLISIEELGDSPTSGIRVTIPDGPVYGTNGILSVQLNTPQELTLSGFYMYYLFIRDSQFYLASQRLYNGGNSVGLVAVICPNTKYPVTGILPAYKYNNIVYKPFTQSEVTHITNPLNQRIGDVEQNVSILKDDNIISNPTYGLSFKSDTSSSIINAIKRIWISASAESYQKLIDNYPEIYLSKINNTPGSYNPYVGLSTTENNDDQIFVWYLTNQTDPREGTETIRLNMTTNWKNELGITDNPYIYITIDWDLIGKNMVFSLINAKIFVDKISKYEPTTDFITFNEIHQQLAQSSYIGQTIVCFGDSLTEMTDISYGHHYTDYLNYFYGINAINVGVGGSQLRQRREPSLNPSTDYEAFAAIDVVNMIKAACEQDFTYQQAAATYLDARPGEAGKKQAILDRLKAIDWSKVDAVTIFAGTNDWYNANTLGVSGSTDVNKTLGAINEIIRMLLTTYPNIKLYWFTPVVRWVSDFNVGTTPPTIDDTKFGDNYSVSGNGTLKDECAAIIQEVTKNHIPVCDMYNNLGWNKYNCNQYFAGTDGSHPRTFKGVSYLARKIFNFIHANKLF